MNRTDTPRKRTRFPIFPAVALLALLVPAWPATGSTEVRRPFEYDFLFPKSIEGAVPPATTIAPEIAPALEAPVDPRTYRVVPGDLLQLEVGGETDRAWRLAVSAEGKLILPGAESIDVAGAILGEVVETVRERLADHFPKQAIALHLLQPGAFRVPVTGQVASPGIQILRAYDRIAFAISAAGGPRPGASVRRVLVRNVNDGTEREADLIRFAILGEIDQNPYLVPGSAVHVPPAQAFVGVSGAVHGLVATPPGLVPNVGSRIVEPPRLRLEWKEEDTIGFTLTRAGGLSEEASGRVLLLRGGVREVLDLAEAESMPVEAGDILEVAVKERYIYVIGAVRYPGPYAHLPSLTAADYVRLAGGPTEIGRGAGWRVRFPDGGQTTEVGTETYLPPGSTVVVPERWTYRVSTLLGPISGITALVISLVALRN